jgi:hypothetical protein
MKPLLQIPHIIRYQILQNPIVYGLVAFMAFIAQGRVEGVWKYECLGWSQYPSFFANLSLFCFLWMINSPSGRLFSDGHFLSTRAIDRRMIVASQSLILAGFMTILLWSAILHLVQPMTPLQISFQSLQDNGDFQTSLLSDPRLGAWQFYDKWKRIIIEIPHGREYQIGIWIYQNLVVALVLLWIGMGLRGPQLWKKVLPFLLMLLALGFSFVNLHYVRKLSENHYLPDLLDYGGQFIFYANYHHWLWIALGMASILIFWSIIRNSLRPS